MKNGGSHGVIASASEAIQSGGRDSGLLRRYAPRNDGGERFAASLPAVDLPAHQRDRLLIHPGRIPGLDRRKIRLAGLVAGAGAPAVGLEEIGGGGQRVG